MNIVPAHKPSWAWNYRWTLLDVDRVREMACRGEPVSWIARAFQTTVGEVLALGQRNDFDFRGEEMTKARSEVRVTPHRVQLSRRKGWRMPADTVKVDRTTPFGNPYQARRDGDGSREMLVDLFREYAARPEQAQFRARVRAELAGKNLACWGPLHGPCHADVLLEIANGAAE